MGLRGRRGRLPRSTGCSVRAGPRWRPHFPVKPVWAELTLAGAVAVAIIGFVWILNSYEIPVRRLERMFAGPREVMGGLHGGLRLSDFGASSDTLAIPIGRSSHSERVLALHLTPMRQSCEGRRNCRAPVTKLLWSRSFAIVGDFSGAISAVALLRADLPLDRHPHSCERALRCDRRRVSGGTALSGLGTIFAAIPRPALIMQSCQSGYGHVGVDRHPLPNIVGGIVLGASRSGSTSIYRKRTGAEAME